jgi:hypothetical protein
LALRRTGVFSEDNRFPEQVLYNEIAVFRR